MLKMGVPEAAVRGKMFTDGFDDDMYDKYLNPETRIQNEESEEDEAGGDDEKKEVEVDPLDPNQPESNQAQPQQQQSQQQSQSSKPSGVFSSSNFVPPADSGTYNIIQYII